MRDPDSVYFDELQMSILNLGFELSAAEKDLLLTPIEDEQNSQYVHPVGTSDCTESHNGLKLKRSRNTQKTKRPSKKDIEMLVSALKSIEEEHIYKKRISEEGIVVRYSNESKANSQVDLNTEVSSSDGSSLQSIYGIKEGSEDVVDLQFDTN